MFQTCFLSSQEAVLRGSEVLEKRLPASTMRIKGINPSYFSKKETMRSSNIRYIEMKDKRNLR